MLISQWLACDDNDNSNHPEDMNNVTVNSPPTDNTNNTVSIRELTGQDQHFLKDMQTLWAL